MLSLSHQQAPSSAADDDALVAACGRGDQAAFAKLVRLHSARVHALALRMTASPADAEEIAQETFWRVWSSAARWQPGGARFTTWLHRIAMNLCIDRQRRARLRRFVQLDDAPEVADATVGQEQQGADRQELATVLAAVGRLPERQRAALLLSADGDLSNKDIAHALGTTEKGVESMLVRARRTLRAALAAGET